MWRLEGGLRCGVTTFHCGQQGGGYATEGGSISGGFPRCYRSDIATLHSATLAATPLPLLPSVSLATPPLRPPSIRHISHL